jgi:hypothetical protein
VKNGRLRFYQHGDMMFNYGCLPQTWEDPDHVTEDTGCKGDNDPIDAVEVGLRQIKTGEVVVVCYFHYYYSILNLVVQSHRSFSNDR